MAHAMHQRGEEKNLGAVGAADVLDMTSAMLVPPMVTTLRGHL